MKMHIIMQASVLAVLLLSLASFNGEKSVNEKAILGGGCFWCVEAIFERVEGVVSVVSGYSGGKTSSPTYDDVCKGATGHAEVVEISFDPKIIRYETILEIFFSTHNPTTLNRQGNDIGDQYRSIIFYTSETQRRIAEKALKTASTLWDDPIVTEILPLSKFYEAEPYHQDYLSNNPKQGYCTIVINPKVEKFKKTFKYHLKKN